MRETAPTDGTPPTSPILDPANAAVGHAPRSSVPTEHEDLRRAIEHIVTSVFGVSRDDLWYTSRGVARVALARQTAMYLAHVVGCVSMTDVGVMFQRDRTTVAHACATVEDRRDDPSFDRALDLMERAIACLRAGRPMPPDRDTAYL
jgi:hypothetical protein